MVDRSALRFTRRQFIAGTCISMSPVTRAFASSHTTTHDPLDRSVVLDGNSVPPITGPGPLSASIVAAIRGSHLSAMKVTMDGDGTYQGVTAFLTRAFPAVMADNANILLPIDNVADIVAAKQAGKLGIIRSFERVGQLNGDPTNVDHFAALGVRVMQLSYNDRSPFAGGALEPDPSSGLTEVGRRAVDRMNVAGVTIDMSHLNAKSAADVIATSKRPAVFTHAGCAALHAHPRNESDTLLAQMAKAGGVIGIYELPFLVAPPRQPDVDDYLTHMIHAINVCGEDHVGVGSDNTFMGSDISPTGLARAQSAILERKARGIAAPEEDRLTYVVGMDGPSRYKVIAQKLTQKGYRAATADKILGGNWLRVFQETWSSTAT